jgi:threonine/homoserine/homoserine lactone efflux protein
MPETATLLLFALSTLALLVIPGPSVIFVVARTLEHGRAAGLVSVLGIETGALVHVVAAAAGLSALLASSPEASTLLRFTGGGYLLWLGARALRTAAPPATAGGPPATTMSKARLFAQGILVDALNLKTALFFMAFLPAFVDPARGPVATQTAVLGLCFVALALVSDGAYAVLAARLGGRLRDGARAERRLARFSAVVYVLLGALAVAGVA